MPPQRARDPCRFRRLLQSPRHQKSLARAGTCADRDSGPTQPQPDGRRDKWTNRPTQINKTHKQTTEANIPGRGTLGRDDGLQAVLFPPLGSSCGRGCCAVGRGCLGLLRRRIFWGCCTVHRLKAGIRPRRRGCGVWGVACRDDVPLRPGGRCRVVSAGAHLIPMLDSGRRMSGTRRGALAARERAVVV